MNHSSSQSIWSARLLAVLFATMATLVFYKGYGRSDQIEQLPIILRAMDSDFLKQDFFTNVTEGAIARLYYSKLLALLYPLTGSLPLLFLLLTWGSNIAISLISFGLARQLFGGSVRAGLTAAALAMAAYTFELGWIASGSTGMLTPTTIALPLVLAAVWAWMRLRLLLAVSLCVTASCIHPLLGLEAGGILLLTDGLRQLSLREPVGRKQLIAWAFSLLLLGLAAIWLVYPQLSQEKIPSAEFIYILAEFRHPHHYLPGTFGYMDYMSALVFLAVVALAFRQWEIRLPDMAVSVAVKWLLGVLLGLALLGYILVELFPMRLVVTAQLFRLLFIVKWLGLMFLAGELARPGLWNRVLVILTLALLIALGPSIRQLLPHVVLLASLGAVLYLYDFFPPKLLKGLSLGALLLASVFFVRGGQVPLPGRMISHPRMGFEIVPELPPAALELAAFAKAESPVDAIFLTPPSWGQFRILAERAIVVDFKAFPFTDVSMKAWHQRLVDCYGESKGSGFHALPGLEANYRSMQDSHLEQLRQRYAADFAVLHQDTPSRFPVVFENELYKLVAL